MGTQGRTMLQSERNTNAYSLRDVLLVAFESAGGCEDGLSQEVAAATAKRIYARCGYSRTKKSLLRKVEEYTTRENITFEEFCTMMMADDVLSKPYDNEDNAKVTWWTKFRNGNLTKMFAWKPAEARSSANSSSVRGQKRDLKSGWNCVAADEDYEVRKCSIIEEPCSAVDHTKTSSRDPPPPYAPIDTESVSCVSEDVVPYLIQPVLEKSMQLERDVAFGKKKSEVATVDRLEVSFKLEGDWTKLSRDSFAFAELLLQQMCKQLEITQDRVVFDRIDSETLQLHFAVAEGTPDLQDVAQQIGKLKKKVLLGFTVRKISMKAAGVGMLQKALQAQIDKCALLEKQLALCQETAI